MKKILGTEYDRVRKIFTNLEARWEILEQHKNWFEDLYRIQVAFIPFAAILRKVADYSAKKYKVKILPKVSNEITSDTSMYLYSDEWKRIGLEKTEELKKICNSLLHGESSVFHDNRLKDGKVRENTKIYYFVRTEKICDGCKKFNSVSIKQQYRPRNKSFASPGNCSCGYYIDIKNLLEVTGKILYEK